MSSAGDASTTCPGAAPHSGPDCASGPSDGTAGAPTRAAGKLLCSAPACSGTWCAALAALGSAAGVPCAALCSVGTEAHDGAAGQANALSAAAGADDGLAAAGADGLAAAAAASSACEDSGIWLSVSAGVCGCWLSLLSCGETGSGRCTSSGQLRLRPASAAALAAGLLPGRLPACAADSDFWLACGPAQHDAAQPCAHSQAGLWAPSWRCSCWDSNSECTVSVATNVRALRAGERPVLPRKRLQHSLNRLAELSVLWAAPGRVSSLWRPLRPSKLIRRTRLSGGLLPAWTSSTCQLRQHQQAAAAAQRGF